MKLWGSKWGTVNVFIWSEGIWKCKKETENSPFLILSLHIILNHHNQKSIKQHVFLNSSKYPNLDDGSSVWLRATFIWDVDRV